MVVGIDYVATEGKPHGVAFLCGEFHLTIFAISWGFPEFYRGSRQSYAKRRTLDVIPFSRTFMKYRKCNRAERELFPGRLLKWRRRFSVHHHLMRSWCQEVLYPQ